MEAPSEHFAHYPVHWIKWRKTESHLYVIRFTGKAAVPAGTYSYAGKQGLIERKEEFRTQTGGVNMCRALEQIEERGVKRGMQKEREFCIQNIIIICKNLGLSIENTINQIMSIYPQPTEQVEEYIQKYWVGSESA